MIRDVSTSLDMTKGSTKRSHDAVRRGFLALLSFRAKPRNL
jgi:hypothetical protein